MQALVGKKIWCCSELEGKSSRKLSICFDVSKFKRPMLKSPRRVIVVLAALENLSNKGLTPEWLL